MPEACNNILKFNQEHKSMNTPFFIYADTKSLLEKIYTYDNNLTKLFTSKINIHTACGYSLFTHCSLDTDKNKDDFYQGKDSMKNFCAYLKEYRYNQGQEKEK